MSNECSIDLSMDDFENGYTGSFRDKKDLSKRIKRVCPTMNQTTIDNIIAGVHFYALPIERQALREEFPNSVLYMGEELCRTYNHENKAKTNDIPAQDEINERLYSLAVEWKESLDPIHSLYIDVLMEREQNE